MKFFFVRNMEEGFYNELRWVGLGVERERKYFGRVFLVVFDVGYGIIFCFLLGGFFFWGEVSSVEGKGWGVV